MSNITIVSVLDRANTVFVDTTKTRWPYEELLTWFNDGVLEIANLRPDSQLENTTFTLTPNQSKQALPANGLRWLDVINDVATGQPIFQTMRRQMDDQVPSWHKTTGQRVRNYVFDDRDPKHIYVYPQVTTAQSIHVCYSVAPTPVVIANFETDTTTLPIDDSYVNALTDFILYRGYSKDADYSANAQRAQAHYQAFLNSVSQKNQTDQSFNPRTRQEQPNG